MSEREAPPRPLQVTVAGGLALAVAVLLVVSLFDAMARVRSVEMRTAVADFLAEASRPAAVEPMLGMLRAVVLVDGALAAAVVVLSVFVLRRHRGARIALTVAVGLLVCTDVLFAAFLSTSGLLPLLLALAAAMLWSAPARDWFAGRRPRPAAEPPAARDGRATLVQAWPPPVASERLDDEAEPPPGPSSQPGPAPHPFGTPPGPPAYPGYAQPGYAQPGYPRPGYLPPGYPQPSPPGRRPGTVTAAAWLTWIFSGLALGFAVLLAAVLVGARDALLKALRDNPDIARQNLSTTNLVAALWVFCVIVAFWSLAAMVLAFLAYRGIGWARVVLAVCAAIAGVAALLPFPVGLLNAAAAFTTVVLLFTGGANEWYAGRRTGAPAPGPGYGGWPAPQPPAPPQSQQPDQGGPERKPPKNVW